LTSNFANMIVSKLSLVMQARLVFFGIALIMLCAVSAKTGEGRRRPESTRKSSPRLMGKVVVTPPRQVK
jgi:hypothetical protein